jgi:putative peptidoglycan lipid II flippase
MPSARFVSSARIIAMLTMGSRVLGLIRDTLLAYLFGTAELLSAFRIAFLVPNLARRLFGEGALNSALIPILAEDLHERGTASARELLGRVLTLLLCVLVAGVAVIEAGLLVWRTIAPDLALDLMVVLLPYMVFICLVAAAGGALNVRGHFAAPALAPMLLNVGIITAASAGVWVFDLEGRLLLYAIAAGVLLSGAVQVAMMAGALRAIGFAPIFSLQWRDPRVATLLRMMAPMIVGLSAFQLNALFDQLLAYWFIDVAGKGRIGPAVIANAQEIYQLPLGVFGIAIATALYPELAARAAAGDEAGVGSAATRGLRLCLFIAPPSAVGLVFVAQPLVKVLFERGAFDAGDTARVAGAVAFYAVGLPAYFAHHVLARAFYALKDSRTPLRTALVMIVVNLGLNVALVGPLQERGLGLATAITAMLQSAYLLWQLQRRLPGTPWREPVGAVLRMMVGLGVMAVALLACRQFLPPDGSASAQLAIMIPLAVAVYVGCAKVLRIDELAAMVHRGDRSPEIGRADDRNSPGA